MLSRGSVVYLSSQFGAVFVTKQANLGFFSYRQERGSGCMAGNGHMPRVSMTSDPSLGTTPRVLLRGTTPGSPTALVIGAPLAGPGIEWVPGCRLLVDPAVVLSAPTTSAEGQSALLIAVPDIGALAGIRLSLQWLVLDSLANPSGLIGSSRLDVLLGH